MKPLKINPTLRQLCAAAGSGMLGLGHATIWGMSATDLVNTTGTNEGALLTAEQSSWFAAIPPLTGILGSSLGGMLTERLGPRKLQLICIPLNIVAFAAMYVASWQSVQEAGLAPVTLMTIRVIQGFVTSLQFPVRVQYPCEITETRLRGVIGGLTEFWSSIGFVICYLLGYYLHWSTMALILPLTTFLPAFFLLLMSPESPIWLARKGKVTEASEVLSCLRHTPEEVLRELDELKADVKEEEPSCMQLIPLFKQRRNALPQTISILIAVFKELTGNITIMFFMVDIFKLAGVGLHPNLCSVIVGCVRILCYLIGSFLLHRLPRRVLLLTGITVVMLANASFGTIFFLEYKGFYIAPVKWLPLAALMLFMIGYATGVGTTSLLVAAEILPNSFRSLGCGIAISAYFITSFITLKTFNYMISSIGLYGIFWFYSASCCAFWFLVYCFMPETRGLSLKEIETFWVKKE